MKSNIEKPDKAEGFFYLSIVVVGVGLLVYIWLQPWAYRSTVDKMGMATLPTAAIALLLIPSIIGLITRKSLKNRQKQPGGDRFELRSVGLLGGATIASVYGLRYADPTIICGIFVLILLLGGGIRDWRLLTGIPIGTALLINILFIKVINTYFPNIWL